MHEQQQNSGAGTANEYDMATVVLDGCRPTPLASYLKALGVLRLIAEQADPDARGYWQDERFILESRLDADGLRRFVLDEYRPTPVIAPWNGGSGFYPKDNQDGIGPLERGAAGRLEDLRDTIAYTRGLLARHGFEVRPEGENKAALLAELRGELSDAALSWLDAAVLLTEESPKYPPLLGTGGNDGRLDFTNNFMQRLVAVMDPNSGQAAAAAPGWLGESLFGEIQPGLPSAKVGQFAPGDAGGPNQGSGFEADKSLVNPWDFILMLEGALLFAATATKRLEGAQHGALSYPFTVRVTGAGSGSMGTGDEDNARHEIWTPLWSSPAGLAEIQALLGEGRATLERRPVRDGLDFARAVSRLGVERGITAFQRYAFLMRSGKAYFATPLNRVAVQRNPAADIIDELDSGGWLGRFRSHSRREGSNRVVSLARRLENTLFNLAAIRDDSAPLVRHLLTVLGEIQLYLARSPNAQEACRPVPSLSAQWLTRADDGSAEMAVAAALAGLHATGSDGAWAMPMRAHLAPERNGRYPVWRQDDSHTVTWHPGAAVADNLTTTLHRRLLEATREQLPDKPLQPSRTAPLAAVAQWLAGAVDERRLSAVLPGLMLVRIAAGASTSAPREAPLPAAYRFLKPLFCTERQLHRAQLLSPESSLPLPPEVVRCLEAGGVDRALKQGRKRLRAAGIGTGYHAVSPGYRDGRRLLAALMVPISDKALQSLLRLEPKPDTEQNS